MRMPVELERKHLVNDLISSGIIGNLSNPNPFIPLPIHNSPVKIPLSIDGIPEPGSLLPTPLRNRIFLSKTETETASCERSKYELSDIFQLYGEDYRNNHTLTPEQGKAMYAIEHCRTDVYGYHIDVCDECGHIERAYNSCRNRHCPKCQGIAKRKWVNTRLAELLPVNYHHATFTLPEPLSRFSMYNQKEIYDLLFEATSQTLLAFGDDPKWLGARIGFYGILHTWSQTIWNHIHIHYIVTAGGVTEDGQWKEPKYKSTFLFPTGALAKVFRGKFIQGLKKLYKKGKLTIPYDKPELNDPDEFEQWLNRLCRKRWVVDSKQPFSGPEEVVRYIGRYTHRVAISNSRILSIENGMIKFSYKDNKEKDKTKIWKEMTLSANDFIERFLWHVLPYRYHRIRHFGFLNNKVKKENIKNIREILQNKDIFDQLEDILEQENEGMPCPKCEKGILRAFIVTDGSGRILKFDLSVFLTKEEIYDTS